MRLSPAQIKEWSQRSTNRKIFLAAAVVGGMTLVVKAVALLKDLVVAQQLGVSSDLDAYLVAFILPQFAINVTAGALQTSLVPTFIEVRDREGEEAAQELFSAVTARALLILVGCVLLFGVIGPLTLPIIGSGFDAHTFELTRNMFFITLPAIVISGMGVIWGAILNAYDRFALAAVAPGAVPLFTIVLLVLTIQQLGVYALALGLIAGFSVQAVLMAWSLRQHHLSLLPRWRTRPEFSHYVRQVMLQFAPAAAGAVLASSTDLVDQAMATPLGAGSVSALTYGSKLLSFVIGVSATALGISILPHFSKDGRGTGLAEGAAYLPNLRISDHRGDAATGSDCRCVLRAYHPARFPAWGVHRRGYGAGQPDTDGAVSPSSRFICC